MATQEIAWGLRRIRRTTWLLLHRETRADTIRYLSTHSYAYSRTWLQERLYTRSIRSRGR